ncbi:hypothetical protein Rsub_09956 [Raphidocelis subcapitata]|uniref:Uncharacterized protein n=1 Tax=Raphidocelis subcapitata TaxID=307507 RepID=A0A2V0PJP4_9CHLO|nr:hypothetical protein Rsub_09956 [Raphidocelis subcapitata]|eukprot:GBF97265.1 hypothetical protein Rsub_09956 [Raphidocelis subcapitata]
MAARPREADQRRTRPGLARSGAAAPAPAPAPAPIASFDSVRFCEDLGLAPVRTRRLHPELPPHLKPKGRPQPPRAVGPRAAGQLVAVPAVGAAPAAAPIIAGAPQQPAAGPTVPCPAAAISAVQAAPALQPGAAAPEGVLPMAAAKPA